MQYRGLNELREMYLSFFETKGHLRLPSFSLIPQNDPSLLLINSGMAPMKPYFTGEQEPPRRRVTTCQKCIRTGDIENVGKTARHGTFFEMLGNFSFGDYFKREAIHWSWEFLTSPDWVGIDPDRLYPSIYVDDDEAFEIWNKEIGIAPERIFRFGKEDNFWEHGSGPCGPCSEIYYDRGPEFGCGKPGCTVGCDCDRYMEVWNNVFSQFDNDGNGNYTELKQKNIDTGMGLERLACVVQGVGSLFDVDTVRNITNKVSEIAGKHYGESDKTDISLRVITDHIRSTVMMICDGVIPSNEGRGYVLRRLLRRAVRHGKLLGIDKPFMSDVASTVIKESGGAYPELVEKQKYIHKVIENEEASFNKTIDSGLAILNDKIAASDGKELSAADAFQLYDTYGFPIDLTLEVLEEQGMTTSREEFDRLMNEQRERAREDRKKMGDLGWQSEDLGLDKSIKTAFDGYTTLEESAKILAIVNEGEVSGAAAKGEKITVVLDRTPFYAEMGGQVGDTGYIESESGERINILNTVKENNLTIHIAERIPSDCSEPFSLHVDADRRLKITNNHTTTHLLDQALREVLGTHVEQKGSFVCPDYLRFDFSHFSKMTDEEIEKVEKRVNELIRANYPLEEKRDATMEEANAMGAIALFGEKYGDKVRVVKFGKSVELCGGTHAKATGQIGMFVIMSEGAVAAGVRRIEAVTGEAAWLRFRAMAESLKNAKAFFNNTPDLGEAIRKIIDENAGYKKEIEEFVQEKVARLAEKISKEAKDINGVKVVQFTQSVDPAMVKGMAGLLQKQMENFVLAAAFEYAGKPNLVLMYSQDLVAKGKNAGKDVREAAKSILGGGGGQPGLATAGGKDVAGLRDALARLVELATA